MQAFIVSVVVAIAIGFGAVYALNVYQEPADVAYTSKTSVRL